MDWTILWLHREFLTFCLYEFELAVLVPPPTVPIGIGLFLLVRKRLELSRVGHDRQPCFGEQLYPCRLPLVPTAISMGLAEHVVLAQVHQVESLSPEKACPRIWSERWKPIFFAGQMPAVFSVIMLE